MRENYSYTCYLRYSPLRYVCTLFSFYGKVSQPYNMFKYFRPSVNYVCTALFIVAFIRFSYLVSPITMDAVDLTLQSGGMSNIVDDSLRITLNSIFYSKNRLLFWSCLWVTSKCHLVDFISITTHLRKSRPKGVKRASTGTSEYTSIHFQVDRLSYKLFDFKWAILSFCTKQIFMYIDIAFIHRSSASILSF